MQSRKLTRPNAPAEVALCFEPHANIVTRIRHPNMPDWAIASCTHGRPIQSRGRCRLDVGWMRLRVRSVHIAGLLEVVCEWLGAICTAQKPHGRPNRTAYSNIGAARTQRRRLFVRTASHASQRPIAHGFASSSTGSADRVRHASALRSARRNACSVGPVDSQAPIYPVTRAKVGFRCEFEGSPAARTDDAAAWAHRRRVEQLAPRAINTTALGAADAGSGRWGMIVSAQARKRARPAAK